MAIEVVLAVINLCMIFAFDGWPRVWFALIAQVGVWLAATALHEFRRERRWKRVDAVVQRHLSEMKSQVNSGVPNMISFDHHNEQVDAALEEMKRITEEK